VTHRAQQIVDLCASLIGANTSLAAQVYTHRTLSLSLAPDEAELPCVSVSYGGDSPGNDIQHLTNISSALDVQVICACAGENESDVRNELMRLRTQTHIALMADTDLGLSFVLQAMYGGAEPPRFDSSTKSILGTLVTHWTVAYEMSISTPE